jgi:two-component system sensor histidine kinase VicK
MYLHGLSRYVNTIKRYSFNFGHLIARVSLYHMMIINETLRLLYENSRHLNFLIDIANDTIIYSNTSFKELFKTATGPSVLLSYVHPEDREYVIQSYRMYKSGEKNKDFECRIVIDGVPRYYKISIVFITQPGRVIAGCCAEDITDMKDYLDVLNEHNKKKNSILNIISHDLMGPISIIESLSGLLGDHKQVSDERRLQQYVHLINRISKKCIHLIRNFTNQEFLESSAVNLVKARIELVSKMRALIEEYKTGGVDLKKKFTLTSSKEKIYAEIDEDKFFQVINNLISNSLKFTQDGGNIAVSIDEQDTTILVSVEDDGIGIPEKHHDKLFEKFNSARRSGLKGEESIGLGMSIIKTIVDWHKGKIWFDSVEKKGTTFYIELPK